MVAHLLRYSDLDYEMIHFSRDLYMCIALLWCPWRPEVYEYVKYTNLEAFWEESEIEMQSVCQTVRAS